MRHILASPALSLTVLPEWHSVVGAGALSSISAKLPEQLVSGDELSPVDLLDREEKLGLRFGSKGEALLVLGSQVFSGDPDPAIDDVPGSDSQEATPTNSRAEDLETPRSVDPESLKTGYAGSPRR